MKVLPFVFVLGLGVFGASYIVEPGKYSCRWTVVGYVCPDVKVSTR